MSHYDEQRDKHDPVNNPKHYDLAPGLEAIDIIESALTADQYKGYLLGNCLKYRLRAGKKSDAMQDLAKADWYESRLKR